MKRKDVKNVYFDFIEIQQKNLHYQSKVIIWLFILLLLSLSANIYLILR